MVDHATGLTPPSPRALLAQPPDNVAAGKGGANRQRIVDAALDLFMERGYAETSIGDVADAAGLLKGNLSYYFKTKADLLEAVSEARQAELFARLQARLPAQPTPLQAIDAFIQVTQDSAEELARVGCPVGSLASQLGKSDPALQPLASRILEALRDWLVAQFGRVHPPPVAQGHAEHLLTLLQGAATMAHAFRDPGLIARQSAAARAWLRTALPDTTATAPQ
jgi:TetR/AcrR family transcriptional regulator, transcriptional repressor for nem operon